MKNLILLILLATWSAFADYVVHEKTITQGSTSEGYKYQHSKIVLNEAESGRSVEVYNFEYTDPKGKFHSEQWFVAHEPVIIGSEHFTATYRPPLTNEETEYIKSLAYEERQKSIQSLPREQQQSAQNFIPHGSMTYTPKPEDYRRQAQSFSEGIKRESQTLRQGIEGDIARRNSEARYQNAVIEYGNNLHAHITRQRDVSVIQSRIVGVDSYSSTLQSIEYLEFQRKLAQDPGRIERILDEGGLTADKIKDLSKNLEPREFAKEVSLRTSPLNSNAENNKDKLKEYLDKNGLISGNTFQGRDVYIPPNQMGHEFQGLANELAANYNQMQGPVIQSIGGAVHTYLEIAQRKLAAGDEAGAAVALNKAKEISEYLNGTKSSAELYENPELRNKIHEQAFRDLTGNANGSFHEVMGDVYSQSNSDAIKSVGNAWLGAAEDIVSSEVFKSTALVIADVAIGMVPGVGFARDVVEVLSNQNMLTGEILTPTERAIAVVGVLTAGAGSAVLKAVPKVIDKLGPIYKGSKAILGNAIETAVKHGQDYSRFLRNSIPGVRQAQALRPDFIAKAMDESPGAVYALGQNIQKHGTEFGKDLLGYAKDKNLNITDTAHLSLFGGGRTKFISKSDYDDIIKNGFISGSDRERIFTIPSAYADKIEPLSTSNIDEFVKKLGLPDSKRFETGVVRIDIPFKTRHNPRLPEGTGSSVNEFFRPGGFIKDTRIPEIVSDRVDLKDGSFRIIK